MVKVKNILFIAPHRKNRSPSQRFRFEQFIPFFEQNGYKITYSSILDQEDDKILYSYGNTLKKILIGFKGVVIRYKDYLNIKNYDLVFILRTSFLIENALFERSLKNKKVKVIFDFDDAIWLPNISEANKRLKWLKRPSITRKIISNCDSIITGNKYLADYAKSFNTQVSIIPTSVDTSQYVPLENKNFENKDTIIIGWSGSHTTIQHFNYATPFLKILLAKYNRRLKIVVIGDESYYNPELDIKGVAWSSEKELELLQEFDIGIMPLPDDDWSKGKCGLKGLLYMSLEIATVMSPVGVNKEIIQDGTNGFLASTDEEWVEKISILIESAELRKKLGIAGRKTVIEKYSVEANKESYIKLFTSLTNNDIQSDLLNQSANTKQTPEAPPLQYALKENSKCELNGKTIYQFDIDSNNIDLKTVMSFGEEWLKFSAFTIKETEIAFKQYFDIVTENMVNSNSIVLDMGCGNGRWSKCLASKVKFIEAMDPSNSVYSALQLTRNINNIRISQASVDHIPFENNSFDFVMSLGVLHHIPHTGEAMKKCTIKLKEGGWFLVYLYYDLEGRSVFLKIPFYISSNLRKIISRLPTLLKHIICDFFAFFVYLPLIGLGKLLKLIFKNKNWHKSIPLSYYIDKPLIIIRNDALDRFGTPLENRFSKSEIYKMMTEAGLTNIKFSSNEPYWHAVGQKISNK